VRRRTIGRNENKAPQADDAEAHRRDNGREPSRFVVSNLQELKRQMRELEEARDERMALAEVLRVISSSAGELPVQTISRFEP
jgi:hypothetical protein